MKEWFKTNLLFPFRNHVRAGLIILGSMVGMLIFYIGRASIDGYFDSLYVKAKAFLEGTAVIYNTTPKQLEALQDKLEGGYFEESYVMTDCLELQNKHTYRNHKIDLGIKLLGNGILTSHTQSFLSDMDGTYMLAKSKYMHGRALTDVELSKGEPVVVIEGYASELIFGHTNSVGEKLKLCSYYGEIELEVVGVIENLSFRASEISSLKRALYNGSSDIEAQLGVYVPSNFIKGRFANDDSMAINVVFWEKTSDSLANSLINGIYRDSGFTCGINSREISLSICDELRESVKGLFTLLMAVVMIFSSLIMAAIFIFGVKERVYEIGVRRAIGASGFDIFQQFLLEGVMYAIVSATLSFILGTAIVNLVNLFLKKAAFQGFGLVISGRLVFSVFGMAIIQGMVFSVIPAMLASKTEPTSAIRWD